MKSPLKALPSSLRTPHHPRPALALPALRKTAPPNLTYIPHIVLGASVSTKSNASATSLHIVQRIPTVLPAPAQAPRHLLHPPTPHSAFVHSLVSSTAPPLPTLPMQPCSLLQKQPLKPLTIQTLPDYPPLPPNLTTPIPSQPIAPSPSSPTPWPLPPHSTPLQLSLHPTGTMHAPSTPLVTPPSSITCNHFQRPSQSEASVAPAL